MSTATEYRSLLAKYLPQPIRSVAAYRRAVAQLEKLMVPHPGAARSLLIELLSTLIEKYEAREYPVSQVAPAEMLTHLLESRGIKPAQLARDTGILPPTLSNVLARRRGISKRNAIKLGQYFGVSPLVFLTRTDDDRRQPASREATAG